MVVPMSAGSWLLLRTGTLGFRFSDGTAGLCRLGRMSGVPSDHPCLFVRLTPLGYWRIAIRLITLESGAVLDDRNGRVGINRISACGRCLGGCRARSKCCKRQKRYRFHGSLDGKARAWNARDRRANGARRPQRTSESERWPVESSQPNADRLLVRTQVEARKSFVDELQRHRARDRSRCATGRAGAAMRSGSGGIAGIGRGVGCGTRVLFVIVAIRAGRLASPMCSSFVAAGDAAGAGMLESPALPHGHG
jgi:hypothetical protein